MSFKIILPIVKQTKIMERLKETHKDSTDDDQTEE